jgi:ethanolamine kinase
MRKPKLAAEIAKQLHKFHEVEIPGSKESQLWNDISKFFDKGFLSPLDGGLAMPSVNIYCLKLVYLDLVFNFQLFDLLFPRFFDS